MKIRVTLYIDAPDHTAAQDYEDAQQSILFTLSLIGMHARFGRVEFLDGEPKRLPAVNCNMPEGQPS